MQIILLGLLGLVAIYFLFNYAKRRFIGKERTEESILKRVNKHYPDRKVRER
ncbi:hypothetical protein [Leptospira sp. id769339]|uniref:hypothetical protein n=1 Tax=Leptospira sp. id769339 TaxID=2864221 RepID=UPI00214C57DC|nr:hypothetical protein [Leptospira sp. id769339]MCR1794879.1 hypothetical protein [Leptospira sp. id769339]